MNTEKLINSIAKRICRLNHEILKLNYALTEYKYKICKSDISLHFYNRLLKEHAVKQDNINQLISVLLDISSLKAEMKVKKVINAETIFKKLVDKYVKKTMSENIPYNETHPFWECKTFQNSLMKHFYNNKEYEKCIQIIKQEPI